MAARKNSEDNERANIPGRGSDETPARPPATPATAAIPLITQDPLGGRIPSLAGRDRDTAAELARFHPDLAGLFRLGHELMSRLGEPGAMFLLGHVGRELANAVERYLAGEDARGGPARESEQGASKETNRTRIGAVLGLAPEHSLVSTWFRVKQVFVGSCHYGATPAQDELRTAFRDFSDLLFGRLGPYFAT